MGSATRSRLRVAQQCEDQGFHYKKHHHECDEATQTSDWSHPRSLPGGFCWIIGNSNLVIRLLCDLVRATTGFFHFGPPFKQLYAPHFLESIPISVPPVPGVCVRKLPAHPLAVADARHGWLLFANRGGPGHELVGLGVSKTRPIETSARSAA